MGPRIGLAAGQRLLAMLLAAALLAGCGGWRLRGMDAAGSVDTSGAVPVRLTGELGTPFGRALAAALSEAGLRTAAADAPLLHVSAVASERRTASVTEDVEAAEFELVERATLEVVAADGTAVGDPVALRAERVYAYDQDAVVAASEEADLLREELREDLVRQALAMLAGATRGLAAGG